MNHQANSTPDKTPQSTKDKIKHILESDPGEITYGFTNDYMFRAVFQKNQAALKGLVAAALGYKTEEITSCIVLNPIILGEHIDSKTCILDIRVCINNQIAVNVEMQMGNLFNWPKRSLYYTCSMFTDLNSGQDYNQAPPCVHIGFVSDSPFKDDQQFFSRYLLTEQTSRRILTDEFSLVMINLKHIPEDLPESAGLREIRCWAQLLCAKNWKEAIHMSEQSTLMQEAIVTMHELSQEEKIREQCLARILYQGDISGAREKGYKDGHKEGLKEGLKEGQQEGRSEILVLVQHLIRANRMDDLKRIDSDPNYLEQLLAEFGLS